MILRRLALAILGLMLMGCATTPPSKSQDICAIFSEKSSWYKQAKKSEKAWGTPVPTLMSIMFQESQFKHDARPPRRKILWVIPGPRLSDAFGYPQAKNGTWRDFQKATGKPWARRDNFKDAIYFIGWYNRQGQARSGIGASDSYNLYLAYHEGHGGYNRGTYKNKAWLLRTAANVAQRADRYSEQLRSCEAQFNRSWW